MRSEIILAAMILFGGLAIAATKHSPSPAAAHPTVAPASAETTADAIHASTAGAEGHTTHDSAPAVSLDIAQDQPTSPNFVAAAPPPPEPFTPPPPAAKPRAQPVYRQTYSSCGPGGCGQGFQPIRRLFGRRR